MDDPDKRNITLSPEHAAAIDDVVAAGEYPSDSDVIREALQDWKERRDNFGYTIAELRRLVQEGIDSGISNENGPDFMRRMKDKYLAKAAKAG